MRTLPAALTVLAALLFAPAAHADTIKNLTAAIDSPSAAANARTTYALGFTTSSTGALSAGNTVTIDLPSSPAVDTSTLIGGTVSVGSTAVGSCPTVHGAEITCNLNQAIAASTAVTLRLDGLRNPDEAATYTLYVHTTADTQAGVNFDVVQSNQLAQPTLTNTYSPATGARTEWVTTFTTTATGGLAQTAGSQITLVVPGTASLAAMIGGTVTVGSTVVGSCPSRDGVLITCVLNNGQTIAPGATVKVTVDGITNPTSQGSANVIVETTSDQSRTSAGVTIVGQSLMGQPALANLGATVAGARTKYTVQFATTATTGTLAQAAGSTITLDVTGADGSGVSASVLDVSTAQTVGSCPQHVTSTITCSLSTGAVVNGGDSLRVTLSGIVNPTTSGPFGIQVSTTSDTQKTFSSNIAIDPAAGVTGVGLTNLGSTSAGGRTSYAEDFTLPSGSQLSADVGSQVKLAFPNGFDISTAYGGTLTDVTAGTDVGTCPSRDPVNKIATCQLNTGQSVIGGHAMRVTLYGVTNPAQAGDFAVAVSTTSNPTYVNSDNLITIDDRSAISDLAVDNHSPTAAAGGRTIYVATFVVSAGGVLTNDANSQILVTLPAGSVTSSTNGTIRDTTAGRDVGTCPSHSGQSVTCSLNDGTTIASGHRVTLTLNAVANTTATGPAPVQITTTSDTSPVSASVDVVAAHPVAQLTGGPADKTPGATTSYALDFHTSSTGALSYFASSQLTVVFAPGTTFAVQAGGTITDGAATVGSCPSHGGVTLLCSLNTAVLIPGNEDLKLNATGIVNPTSQGTVALQVSTTSDTAASLTYAIGTPTTPDTGIVSGPSGTVSGDVTFAFTSNIAGATFECRMDDGGYEACTSPKTYSGLPSGNHDFIVRSSAAGLTDTTPAERTFAIAAAAAGPTVEPNGSGGFLFTATQPGSTFQCSIDGGAFSDCGSPYTPPSLPPGDHTLSVRSIDPAGNPSAQPTTRTFTVASTPAATPTPTPTPSPTPTPTPTPTPVPGKTVVAAPAGGTVLVQLPGQHGFTTVSAAEGIPLGSTVDTRHGVVQITAAGGGMAKFYDGLFKVTQSSGVTILTLTEQLAPCGKGGARASAKKPRTRKLWGDGHGAFSTRGQYSAATVRGTKWLVQDSCAGTLTKVAVGVVAVRDNVKRKTILLKAGKQYLAKPRKH